MYRGGRAASHVHITVLKRRGRSTSDVRAIKRIGAREQQWRHSKYSTPERQWRPTEYWSTAFERLPAGRSIVNFQFLSDSGVTRVGVTRGGNWRCRPFFLAEKTDDLFSVIAVCTVITFFKPSSRHNLFSYLQTRGEISEIIRTVLCCIVYWSCAQS